MQKIILSVSACGLLLAFSVLASAQEAKKAEINNSKLPKVLLLGDSISGGYARDVENLLRDKAKVVHEGDIGYATPYTTPALEKLDELLAWTHWDIVHFNFGLNDFEGSRLSPEQYERNLREIVRRLKSAKCALIWCSTTPIVPGKLSSNRDYRDVVRYNDVARKVMEENKIPIDDLYSFALPRLKEIQIKEDVHFKPEGYAVLAKHVASEIERKLPK
jgi:lysophospholipase L1-like esterase